jgi:hypothetical protein
MLPWWAWAIAALEVEGGVGGGELVPAATAASTATTAVAASPQRQRSTFLDRGEPMVPGLARHPRRRHSGHGATLAPSRLEGLLARAVETRSKGGSPPYCAGATGPDPTHGRRQSIVALGEIGQDRVPGPRVHIQLLASAEGLGRVVGYFNNWRPHRSIGQRAPCAPSTPAPHRSAQAGKIIAILVLGGLHHVYQRAA